MIHRREVIELTEYVATRFPRDRLGEIVAETLYRNYGNQVAVEWPSPKTNGEWQLTSQGWVGHIPLTSDFRIVLSPKVAVGNLFRMLEYAYRLKSFHFLQGLVDAESLEDFYERLANVLAKRILDRGRRGFYRTYLSHDENLPYLCGRLDIQRVMRAPWDVKLTCHYHEHTADIEENQILVWTLGAVLKSGLCTERVLPYIRKAFRTLQSFASLTPCSPGACINRLYNRLNDDYEPLHALCRFFLEHRGPSHQVGDHPVLPFLIDMGRLFELFVAEWLRANLPHGVKLKAQEAVDIDQEGILRFAIDLVLYDDTTGDAICVLDTKYKAPETPATADIAQVTAYAEVKACNMAFLVYPAGLAHPLNVTVGPVRVRNLTFSLGGDIEEAGQAFLAELLTLLNRDEGKTDEMGGITPGRPP